MALKFVTDNGVVMVVEELSEDWYSKASGYD